MKTTDWYPGYVKPVRVGVYGVKSKRFGFILYKYWNGSKWAVYGVTIDQAMKNRRKLKDSHQDWKWRGVAK